MHGRGPGRPDTDPISWMKSVKIGASWDIDSLAEELTLVADKFKRIDFETINITQRRATVSLQSPWGEDKTNPVYMRLDFKFPKLYPKDAQAIVHVQRTNSIASELQKSLSVDINAITEAYKDCGRGCLEAIFRYVLREQTLDQIIAMTLHDSMSESRLIAAADGVGDASEDSDDDEIGPNTRTHLIDPVPLTKGCAALWAENGKLICFFEPKEKASPSLLYPLGTGRLDDPDTRRLFGGFGRFQVDSPSRKTRERPSTAEEDSGSEASEQSSLFSSSTSSSDSSLGLGLDKTNALWQRPRLIPEQQYKSADGSQKSTVQDTVRGSETTKKTIVTVHDFSHILPAQNGIASEYRLVGDIAVIAQHNLSVAERHSLWTISGTWRLVHNFFSLPTPSSTDAKTSEFIKHLETDGPTGQAVLKSSPDIVPWMDHIAVTQVFPSLLQFYEQTSDVQMLGMLAGVFLQTQATKLKELSNPAASPNTDFHKDNRTNHGKLDFRFHPPQYSGGNQAEQQMNIELAAERISHSQSPNDRIGDRPDAIKHYAFSKTSSRRTASTNVSSRAPSVLVHNTSGPASAINSTVVSLAGSPENYRIATRKSEPVINYPVATASLQALAKSRPPSPTGSSLRKFMPTYDSVRAAKVSPDSDASRFSRAATKPSLSLGNMHTSSNESQISDSHNVQPRSVLKNGKKKSSSNRTGKKKLKTRFADPRMITQKGPVVPDSEYLMFCRRCVSYAEQYAAQLEVWRLWIQRAEFIKLCGEISTQLDTIDQGYSNNYQSTTDEACLAFRWCCPSCGSYMAPIEKNGIAIGWQCVAAECPSHISKLSKKQRCAVCETVVRGLSVPCTQCGHITCWQCAEEWFGSHQARSSASSNSTSSIATKQLGLDIICPAGCGCHCSQLKEVLVPYPNADNNETEIEETITPTTPRSEGYQEHTTQPLPIGEHRARRGQSIGTMDASANTAMNALLALNLASRHRPTSGTTKNSQVPPHHSSMSQASSTRLGNTDIVDELLPWAHTQSASLSRGSGPGLSRGLSSKGSSSTIRRADGHG